MGITDRLREYARTQRQQGQAPRDARTDRGTDFALPPPDFLNAEAAACELALIEKWRRDPAKVLRAEEVALVVGHDGQAVYASADEVLTTAAMIGMMPAVSPDIVASRRSSSTTWLADVCAAQLERASTDAEFDRVMDVLNPPS